MRLVNRTVIWGIVLGASTALVVSCSSNSKKSAAPAAAPAASEGSENGENGGESDEAATTTPIEGTRITSEPTPTPEPIRGTLQGYVVDGFAGARVDLDGREDQFFIRIGGDKISPKIDKDDPGYFFFEDVPVNEEYVVYTRFKDALQADYDFTITSHGGRTGTDVDTVERWKERPNLHQNIRMFGFEQFSRDFEMRVTYNGSAVEDATVKLIPQPKSEFDRNASEFMAVRNTATATSGLSGKTNAEGIAVFKAESLSVGATYSFEVIPPEDSDLGYADGSFEMGLTDTGVDGLNFRMDAELELLNDKLEMVSCNTKDTQYDNQLTLVYVFNQDIEVVDPDSFTASLAYDTLETPPNTAVTIAQDQDGEDGVNDQVDYTVAANVLTVKPKIDQNGARTTLNRNDDWHLTFTLTSFKVRSTVRRDDKDGTLVVPPSPVPDPAPVTLLKTGCAASIQYGKRP